MDGRAAYGAPIALLHLPPWEPPAVVGSVVTSRLRMEPEVRDAPGDATSHRPGPGAVWLVVRLLDRGGGTDLGTATVGPVDAAVHAAEIEVELRPAARGRGLAVEALRHLISAALTGQAEGGWGLRRVSLEAAASNAPARGVARALGVRREARRRQDRWTEGVGIDGTLAWAVLAEEWDTSTHRPVSVRSGADADVGVGPHPRPWPDDPRLDPDLLAGGDRRNVADRYRYWRVEAIAADLRASSHPFHVAIENWAHDLNIGTVVRNANAFGARAVHVVGRRRWNRRGAMVTDRYLDIVHHPDIGALVAVAEAEGMAVVGVDNLPGSHSLLATTLPRRCVLLFGQEGPGLSAAARAAADTVLHIPQVGSTRSINAGVASGIAMATWLAQHQPAGGGS